MRRFFKFWDSRALNEFIIEPLAMNETNGLRGFVSYSEDTNQLVRRIEGDIAYIDPPCTPSPNMCQPITFWRHLPSTTIRILPGLAARGEEETKTLCMPED